MKVFDVAAIGSGSIDIILSIPALPDKGNKAVGKQLDQQIGGTIANSACVMSRLGLRVASVSCVGDSDQGKAIVNDFHKFGVNCDFIHVVPGMKANLAVIFIDATGERSLIYTPGDAHEWNEAKAQEAIQQSRFLYSMPEDIEKFKKLAGFARTSGTKVIVDIEPHIGGTRERLDAILTHTDIAIFNREGFIAGVGVEPQTQTLKKLQKEYGLDALVVTLDAAGVTGVTADEAATLPSFNVPVIDTTGAGDSFNGAFIYAFGQQKPLRDALAFASATAAINISALGARGRLPTAAEVNAFISQHA